MLPPRSPLLALAPATRPNHARIDTGPNHAHPIRVAAQPLKHGLLLSLTHGDHQVSFEGEDPLTLKPARRLGAFPIPQGGIRSRRDRVVALHEWDAQLARRRQRRKARVPVLGVQQIGGVILEVRS